MKKHLMLLIFVFTTVLYTQKAIAQEDNSTPKDSVEVVSKKLYTFRDAGITPPRFPVAEEDKDRYGDSDGADYPLYEFVKNNLRYPHSAYELKKQGQVFISFVITSEGELKNIKVQKSVYRLLDEEGVRIVSLMPDKGWTPAMIDGQAVDYLLEYPFNFKIRDGE